MEDGGNEGLNMLIILEWRYIIADIVTVDASA